MIFRRLTYIALGLTLLLLSSCTKMITKAVVTPAVNNIQQQTDIQLVCDGAPSYLLMVDAMVAGNPEDEDFLRIGSQSFIGYVNALNQCESSKEKIRVNSDKAKLYGLRLLDQTTSLLKEPKAFNSNLQKTSKGDVPSLFWGGYGLLTWIQQQNGSPAAMAKLITVEKIMQRVLELDETYQGAGAHLFFGGYLATKPALLGGNPEKARLHFEQALKIGERKFLLTQVTYAKTFARSKFDQKLHDSLLKEVLEFDLNSAPEFGLSNRIAQEKAKELLEEDYFL